MKTSAVTPTIRENLANNGLLGSERDDGRLWFRPRPDWPRDVLGVAWLRCQRTRAGVEVLLLLGQRLVLPPPHWLARFEDPRQHPVWLEALLDVDVFVCVLVFLEGWVLFECSNGGIGH